MANNISLYKILTSLKNMVYVLQIALGIEFNKLIKISVFQMKEYYPICQLQIQLTMVKNINYLVLKLQPQDYLSFDIMSKLTIYYPNLNGDKTFSKSTHKYFNFTNRVIKQNNYNRKQLNMKIIKIVMAFSEIMICLKVDLMINFEKCIYDNQQDKIYFNIIMLAQAYDEMMLNNKRARLSKMTEEQAAQIYEKRKQELFKVLNIKQKINNNSSPVKPKIPKSPSIKELIQMKNKSKQKGSMNKMNIVQNRKLSQKNVNLGSYSKRFNQKNQGNSKKQSKVMKLRTLDFDILLV